MGKYYYKLYGCIQDVLVGRKYLVGLFTQHSLSTDEDSILLLISFLSLYIINKKYMDDNNNDYVLYNDLNHDDNHIMLYDYKYIMTSYTSLQHYLT